MKIVRTLSTLSLATLLFAPAVIAAPAHVHGSAKLDISIEGDKLNIGLEMPLDSTVGFERPARNDNEKLAYANAMTALRNAGELFKPTAGAGCRIESVEVGDPFPGGKAKPADHADIDADYAFRCAKPAALKGIETTLFQQFKRLRRIDVQRATPSGQGKASMTPESPSLNW